MQIDNNSIVANVAHDKPIIFIDTCSILDIMRDPTRGDADLDRAPQSKAFVEDLRAGAVTGMIADQNSVELSVHIDEIERESRQKITAFKARIKAINSIVCGFSKFVPVNTDHFDDYVARSRSVSEDIIANSYVFQPTDTATIKAIARMNQARTPSARGKSEAKDCIVVESLIEAVETLRASGYVQPVVFLSSNKNDYAEPATARLKSDLGTEFTALGINYALNISMARYIVGLIK